MTRADLERIPAETETLRRVRHITADDVTDITDAELVKAREWMLLASSLCADGARAFDRILNQRKPDP